MPRIRYEMTEIYWQKMYKKEASSDPADLGKRPQENPPQSMQIKKNTKMQQKRKKRQNDHPDQALYDEFIGGNQSLNQHEPLLFDPDPQDSNLKRYVKLQKEGLPKTFSSNNIIQDSYSVDEYTTYAER